MEESMSNGTKVIKRNGSIEGLDLNKLHLMVEEACKDLAGVSASQVEMQSGIQFYDGITTSEVQEILIRSASDLIDLDHPNYQFVAARLLLFALRKQLFGRMHECPVLIQHVHNCIDRGVYDAEILSLYSDEEFEKLQSFIVHERDYLFTYAGLRQVVDKYLVQDRSSGALYETPQFMYLMIAATIFSKYPKETRLDYVKKYYDAISKHKINIPTPIMAGVRTPLRQFASCVLVDVDDTLDSIFSSDVAIGKYVSQRAGIGINAGRIRGINSKIRGGEVQHTGVVPFLKKFEATVRCCTQNGIRGGSATVFFPIWHQEIEDILVLKNNKGTEDNPYKDQITMSNLCVAGDTKIYVTVDLGKPDIFDLCESIATGYISLMSQVSFTIKIEDLQKLIDNGVKIENIEVASHSFENNFLTTKPITAFAQTSPKAKVMKITDEESGKSIVVTPEHKVFTKNRGYVMAKDLTETDELMIINM
jgi:hypothetical protein